MLPILVHNPVAGRGRWTNDVGLIAEKAATALGVTRVELMQTTAPGHALQHLQALDRLPSHVLVLGGDGTVSEVCAALKHTSCALAPLPGGTGNDLCRALGWGSDPIAAAAKLQHAQVAPLDLGECRSQEWSGWTVNIAGIGFDAEVARRANQGFRFLSGMPAYLAAVISTLATLNPFDLVIEMDERTIDTKALLCAVANSASYGGGMRIAPNALPDDGQFEVVVIGPASKADFLRTFPRVFSGTHLSHPLVEVYRSRSVKIRADDRIPIMVDGDVRAGGSMDFRMHSGALQVLRPGTTA
jgi:diacylglycerol kinase (ATP)